MFWNRKQTNAGDVKLTGPKAIADPVGRYMVVHEKKDPDWVWRLKCVVRPGSNKKTFYCRVFDEPQAKSRGLQVKDWTSLDEHQELIIWEGYFSKEPNIARPEKFVNQAGLSA